MKTCCLFIWLCTRVFGYDIEWNGTVYDDETVAQLITVITTTNPIPSIPSIKHIYPSQVALFQIPAFARCKKIIVFDGLQPWWEHRRLDYEQYKRNVAALCADDPYFANTQLVFCEQWEHLSGAVSQAMRYVTTPYVYLHQHDFVLKKPFDFNGVIASMERNPNIKHVKLCWGPRNQYVFKSEEMDTCVHGPSFVPLCRLFFWSDQDHVASTAYYNEFVLPYCYLCPMEDALGPLLEQTQALLGTQCHPLFGTYIYGTPEDGDYLDHSDGRDLGNVVNNRLGP
jgi:hypothetical protein